MKRKRLLSVLVSAVVVIGVAVPLQANYTQYEPYDAAEDAIIDFDPFNGTGWIIIEPSGSGIGSPPSGCWIGGGRP